MLTGNVPNVNILLDDDAVLQSLDIFEFLLKNNIRLKWVKIPDHDPSDFGFKNTWEVIRKTDVMDFEDFVNIKLNECN